MNENVLAGVRCPKCGFTDCFRIAAICWAEVIDDGVEGADEYEWNEDSWCECYRCSYAAKYVEFMEPDDA
jgi:DNA-directed RNA polymerase subunit RPC12/RpoP